MYVANTMYKKLMRLNSHQTMKTITKLLQRSRNHVGLKENGWKCRLSC
jgi:hypothetical protein